MDIWRALTRRGCLIWVESGSPARPELSCPEDAIDAVSCKVNNTDELGKHVRRSVKDEKREQTGETGEKRGKVKLTSPATSMWEMSAATPGAPRIS